MNEFLKIILGNQTLAGFVGNMVLAIVGIIVKLQWDANKRDANSPTTPVNFSFAFLLKDNALRLFSSFAFSLFIIYIAVRFTDQLLHVQLSPFIALLIGLASDSIASLLKNLTKDISAFTPVATTATNSTGQQTAIDPNKPAVEQVGIKDTTTIATTSVKDEAVAEQKTQSPSAEAIISSKDRELEPWENNININTPSAQPSQSIASILPQQDAEIKKQAALAGEATTATLTPNFTATSPLPNASDMGNTTGG